jgi:hypothetical protein
MSIVSRETHVWFDAHDTLLRRTKLVKPHLVELPLSEGVFEQLIRLDQQGLTSGHFIEHAKKLLKINGNFSTPSELVRSLTGEPRLEWGFFNFDYVRKKESKPHSRIGKFSPIGRRLINIISDYKYEREYFYGYKLQQEQIAELKQLNHEGVKTMIMSNIPDQARDVFINHMREAIELTYQCLLRPNPGLSGLDTKCVNYGLWNIIHDVDMAIFDDDGSLLKLYEALRRYLKKGSNIRIYTPFSKTKILQQPYTNKLKYPFEDNPLWMEEVTYNACAQTILNDINQAKKVGGFKYLAS